jgi:hypothetical protein
MSNKDRRKPPSRRNRRHEETPESVAFRRHMADERGAEELDYGALAAISDLLGLVDLDGEPLPLVEPLRPYDDHTDFDRAVCKAGIKAFVRRTMESDQPGHGTPLDPLTHLPDPTIPIPEDRFPDHVIVREACEGMRWKFGIQLEAPP